MKFYPTLSPSASGDDADESQVYRLKKIEEIEEFLRNEIKERDGLAKKFKMHGTWVRYCDHGLLSVNVITTGIGIGVLATGFGAPLGITMGGIAIAMGIGQASLRNVSRRLNVKAQKHESIRLLAESKLNSVVDFISKAIENGVISEHEYSLIMQEKQRYMVLKKQIRQRVKRTVNNINERERAQLVANGRQEGQEEI